jgi:hypothetical protein
MNSKILRQRMTGVLIASALVAGCATTAPQADYTQALPAGSVVNSNDTVTVAVAAKSGVTLIQPERERLSQRIAARIDNLKQRNAAAQEPQPYRIEVLVTRYDKGNAFARFVFAGLGQIHIDGQVTLFALPQNERLTHFNIQKTFAWGGIYGGTTTIETVEEGFAEGIAEALTQTHP